MFRLREGSKLHNSSEVQAEALQVIRSTKSSGIVILPCGSGKTSVFLQAALDAGNRVLFLCYEKQGVMQVAETIRQHSTVQDSHLCVYSSEMKAQPNRLLCYFVTTYNMFSATTAARSPATQLVRQYVTTTKWDLVVLDEVHHSGAQTYRPLIETLVRNSKRTLGFTGTLCRSLSVSASTSGMSREELQEEQFEFIGKVLYQKTCTELEKEGLIAKVRRMEIFTRLTPDFEVAHQEVQGSLKKYVESLHPSKLNAVWMLVQMHVAIGQIGMIFVNHLLNAKIVQRMLGQRCEILSGGNAHGTDGIHTAEANAGIVNRFNSGEIDVIVSTPVGGEGLDIHNSRFRYAIVIDAHGGQAPASQKLGRLSRTPRLIAQPGESREDQRRRRLAAQKEAAYYEIVTPDTEEVSAANARHEQFRHDGYDCCSLEYDELVTRASACGISEAEAPFDSDVTQIRLLAETLSYQHLGEEETLGNVCARNKMAPHRADIQKQRNRLSGPSSHLFKDRARQKLVRLRKQLPEQRAEAQRAKHKSMGDAEPAEVLVRVLRQLGTSEELLQRAGVELPPPPLLDDEDDEFGL